MVGTIVHQLTRNLTEEQIKEAGFEPYFVDHTTGVFPQFASGYPWSASTMQVTGDTIADLTEDLAADAATVQEQHGALSGRVPRRLLYSALSSSGNHRTS